VSSLAEVCIDGTWEQLKLKMDVLALCLMFEVLTVRSTALLDVMPYSLSDFYLHLGGT
jgi:hypothetical protein